MRPRGRLIAWMLLVSALVVALALLSVPAAAAAAPAPGTGITGACNMANAWGAGVQGGMAHAMSVNNPNGNAGMAIAVANSGC
jgi:hypothetical protein